MHLENAIKRKFDGDGDIYTFATCNGLLRGIELVYVKMFMEIK